MTFRYRSNEAAASRSTWKFKLWVWNTTVVQRLVTDDDDGDGGGGGDDDDDDDDTEVTRML